MSRVGIGLAALLIAASPWLALAGGAASAAPEAEVIRTAPGRSAPTRTAKERLSGKAADEQRVDNCKVPLELRGTTPRPDDCGGSVGARNR